MVSVKMSNKNSCNSSHFYCVSVKNADLSAFAHIEDVLCPIFECEHLRGTEAGFGWHRSTGPKKSELHYWMAGFKLPHSGC